MAQKTVKDPKSLARMPFAGADKTRSAIVFRLECHDGTGENYACEPAAIPEIMVKLSAAYAVLAKAAGDTARSLLVQKASVSPEGHLGHVGLTLRIFENTDVPFHLDADQAEQLSTELALAAAKIRPQRPERQN